MSENQKNKISQEQFDAWLSLSATQAFFNVIKAHKIAAVMDRIIESNKPADQMDGSKIMRLQGRDELCWQLLNFENIDEFNAVLNSYEESLKDARKWMNDAFGGEAKSTQLVKV